MSPFARWFGAKMLKREGGEAGLALEVREGFLQGQGLVQGGILAALLDSALGQAVESLGVRVVTAELSVSYLRPVRAGSLLARGLAAAVPFIVTPSTPPFPPFQTGKRTG